MKIKHFNIYPIINFIIIIQYQIIFNMVILFKLIFHLLLKRRPFN